MMISIGTPQGMYLLQSFPRMEKIPLEEFVEGSRADLEEITRRFCEEYNSDVGLVYALEWEHFRDHVAPQSDSVEEWNQHHPVHIPFRDTLLRGEAVCVAPLPDTNPRPKSKKQLFAKNRSRKSKPLDFVNWSRRGEKKNPSDPSLMLPNVVVEGPADIERFSVPVHCKSGKESTVASIASSNVRLPPLNVIARGAQRSCNVEDTSVAASATASSAAEEGVEQEHDDVEDEDTDSDDEDEHGWVTCRGVHNIPKYFGARECVGNTFTVPEKFLEKAFFARKCPVGKINSIVRKAGADANDVYFKFYNREKYPDEAPPDASEAYCYIKCAEFMSSSLPRRMMEWDNKYRKSVAKVATRPKRQFWAMETIGPALFDEEKNVDSTAERKLRSGRHISAPRVEDEPEPMEEAPISRSSSSVMRLPPIQVPPNDVQRERLRHDIYKTLARKGLKKVAEDVELSDMSCSSESDNDDDDD